MRIGFDGCELGCVPFTLVAKDVAVCGCWHTSRETVVEGYMRIAKLCSAPKRAAAVGYETFFLLGSLHEGGRLCSLFDFTSKVLFYRRYFKSVG